MITEDDKPTFVKRDVSVSNKDYMAQLAELKERFRKSQIKAAVKVNTAMLEYYWNMGRDVSRLYAKAHYGSAFFDCLSLDLKAEFPNQTGFSATNIKYTKRWYEFYNQRTENRQRLVDDLGMPIDFGMIPWGQHIDIFTKSRTVNEALFYIEQTIKNNWSRPELNVEIERGLYAAQGKAITNFDGQLPAPFSNLAKEILKSPYDFGFIDRRISEERDFEDAVVCELKVTDFKPEYAGKLNFYVSAVDELMRLEDDNPTIGLLICKSKNDTVVEWSFRGMTQPLGVAEYKLKQYLDERMAALLPSESDIQNLLDSYNK